MNVDKLRRAVEALVQENRKLKSDLELLTLRNQVEQNASESDPAPAKDNASPRSTSK